MVVSRFLSRFARKAIKRAAKTTAGRAFLRKSAVGRVARRVSRTRGARRVGRVATFLEAPARPTARFVGRGFRAAGRFIRTRRGRTALVAASVVGASPILRKKATKAIKKDPSLLLLATPLAAIPIGRGIGKAAEAFIQAPTGKKIAAVAGGVGLLAAGAGLIVAGSKFLKKKGAGAAAQPPVGTPAALAGGVVGAIPTAPQAAAKQPAAEVPKVMKANGGVQPVNVTTKIIVQNF